MTAISHYPRRITIQTAFMSQPMPVWTATIDGQPDMIGHGQREADAVYDLFCQIDERETSLEDWEALMEGRS